MKRVHKSLLTAVVLLGGGGGAAIYTLKTKVKTADERFKEQENQKRLFQFGLNDVQSGRLVSATATVTFTRGPTGWKITEPLEWPGDVEAIDAMISHMVGIKAESVVTEDAKPDELERAGLTPPALTLTLETKKGPKVFQVGARNKLVDRYPITDATRKRIGLSDPSFFWAFDRPAHEFRDKRPFPFSEDEVAGIVIKDADGTLRAHLKKDDTGWALSGKGVDGDIRGDNGTVNLFLVAITKHWKGEQFVTDSYNSEDPEDVKARGFDKPLFVMTVESADGRSKTVTVAPAGTEEAEGVLMHVHGTKTIIEMLPSVREALEQDASAYRNRTLARFKRKAVQKLRLVIGGRPPIVAERNADKTDWILTAPERKPAKVWKIDALTRTFALHKVESWYDESATTAELKEWQLEPPSWQMVFYGENDTVLADIRIGNYATEDRIFSSIGGESRVGLIRDTKVKVLPANFDDLVDADRTLPPPAP